MVVYGKNKQSYSGEPPLKTSYDSPNRQLNQGKVTLSRKQSLSEQSKEPDIVHLSRGRFHQMMRWKSESASTLKTGSLCENSEHLAHPRMKYGVQFTR